MSAETFNRSDKVTDHYDNNNDFADNLNHLLPGFEYPNWSHKTIGEVLDTVSAHHRMLIVDSLNGVKESVDRLHSLTERNPDVKPMSPLLGGAVVTPAGGSNIDGGTNTNAKAEFEGQLSVFESPHKRGVFLVDIVKINKYQQFEWCAVDHDDPIYAQAIRQHRMPKINVIQDAGANNRTFSVIDGAISPAGYPIGKFAVIQSGLRIEDARAMKEKILLDSASLNQATVSLPSSVLNDKYADSIVGENAHRYDAIEIQGVRDLNPPDSPDGTCCEVDNENPQFFSVYVHQKPGGHDGHDDEFGGIECVGDFATHALASGYACELSGKFGWQVNDFTPESAYRVSPNPDYQGSNSFKGKQAVIRSEIAERVGGVENHEHASRSHKAAFQEAKTSGMLAASEYHGQHAKYHEDRAALLCNVVKEGATTGKILIVKDGVVVQKKGRDGEEVRHDATKLSFVPEVDAVVNIKYGDDGKAAVTDVGRGTGKEKGGR